MELLFPHTSKGSFQTSANTDFLWEKVNSLYVVMHDILGKLNPEAFLIQTKPFFFLLTLRIPHNRLNTIRYHREVALENWQTSAMLVYRIETKN